MTQQNNAPEEQTRTTAPVVAEAEAVLEQAATAETAAIMALRFSEEDAVKAGEWSAAMHALFAKYNAPLIVYGLVPVDLEGFRVIKGIVVVKEAEKLLDSSGHHGAFMYAAARSIRSMPATGSLTTSMRLNWRQCANLSWMGHTSYTATR